MLWARMSPNLRFCPWETSCYVAKQRGLAQQKCQRIVCGCVSSHTEIAHPFRLSCAKDRRTSDPHSRPFYSSVDTIHSVYRKYSEDSPSTKPPKQCGKQKHLSASVVQRRRMKFANPLWLKLCQFCTPRLGPISVAERWALGAEDARQKLHTL